MTLILHLIRDPGIRGSRSPFSFHLCALSFVSADKSQYSNVGDIRYALPSCMTMTNEKRAVTHDSFYIYGRARTRRTLHHTLCLYGTLSRHHGTKTNTQLSGTNTISKKEARTVVQGGVLGERLGAVLGSVLAAS